MSPFGNGQPERRRKDTSLPGGRRDDDPDVEMAARFGFWAKLLVVHRTKVVAVGMALAGVGGWLIAAALLGPRVARLETAVVALQSDVTRLKQSEETKMYILCTILRRVDRDAVPKACDASMSATLLNLVNDSVTP